MLLEMIECCKRDGINIDQAYANNSLFIDLCEVQKYWNVKWKSTRNILHCLAQRELSGPTSVFVPVASTSKIPLLEMERLQGIFNTDSIVLVIQDPNSSSVYYEVSKGLVRNTDEKAKRQYSDSFVRNNKKLVLAQAQRKKE